MDNTEGEAKKIKTQIIPAIHNTVSLQAYLQTEDGEPIPNQKVYYKIYTLNDRDDVYYERISDEEGKVHLTLNVKRNLTLELIYYGNDQYEETKIRTVRVKPSQEEKDMKHNDPYQVKIREEAKKKKEEEKKKKQENKLKKIEEYELSQSQYEGSEENISIELRNVSLSFKIGNDKIDNLKEYVIRTLNRTKEKKTIFKATEVIVNGNIAPLLSLGAGFDKNYSGRENIFLNGAILGYDEEFLKEKYDEILEFSELGEFINLPVKNYSSGMLSKLGFSIATIVDPDILILDEVLGVGDITFRKKSKEKLKSLMESHTTVLLVSHSINEIRSICDKAIWIDKGRVVEVGEVNSVCDHYEEEAKNVSKEKTKKLKPKRF